ncbi:MAG: acyl-CoA synthetase [Alphaproteobacteria bacterium]
MTKTLTDITDYAEATSAFSWDRVWDLFDGNKERLNIAHECVDRHPDRADALRIKFEDGHTEIHSFGVLKDISSRFANLLEAKGIARGDRVAVMVNPSLEFYGCMFGAMKRGAVAVPLFTLFGPEALALRLDDCKPKMIVVEPDYDMGEAARPDLVVLRAGADLRAQLAGQGAHYVPDTATNDLAFFQYTSGTTRALPEAIRHTHRAVVTLMVAALFGVGHKPGDRYFSPSSPAWGHGLSHSTISPLALGIAVGSYSGKFDVVRIFEALQEFEITNFAAAPTVFRMMRNSGLVKNYRYTLKKISFTGEPMDTATFDFITAAFGTPPCSMFGTTEVGAIIGSFPGFTGFTVKRGALGRPLPGCEVGVLDDSGNPCPTGQTGELMLKRRGAWFPVKDRGFCDEDGYIFHAGRSDDVIISAGWTMSAVEIEDVLLKHPDIREAAVIGVPDKVRGLIPKAFIVSPRRGTEFEDEIKAFMKDRLSKHEYPRSIAFVAELPKTPAGKVNRKALRDMVAAG